MNKNRKSIIITYILGLVFIVALFFVVLINKNTQENVFWDNQRDKLSMLTEKCRIEIDSWLDVQSTIVENMASILSNESITTREQYESSLKSVLDSNPHIQNAYIGMDTGESFFGDWVASDDYDVLSRVWYIEANENFGETIFVEPYVDFLYNNLVVTCSKAIKLKDGSVGVVSIDISLENVISKINSLETSENGGAYLVSSNGNVMTYDDEDFLPKISNGEVKFLTAQEVLDKVVVVEKIDSYLHNDIGMEYIKDYDGKYKYEATAKIERTNWIIGVNIPLSDYDESVRQIAINQYPIVALAILMMVISLIIAWIFNNNNKRNREMQKNIEIAEMASKTKSEFLSRMSHEMRTPLNAIIGMTKISENANDIDSLKKSMSTVNSSSYYLLNIINDILDMSKIESGKFELSEVEFNIKDMVDNVYNILSESARAKNQIFTIKLGSNLHKRYLADEMRASQILVNIIGNAIKFTDKGKKISVFIDEISTREEDSVVQFEVSDEGIGMSNEQMKKLFSAFEQVDGSITRRFGGTGLGLAISRSIVEKMGGEISVKSVLGEGSTFTFTLVMKKVENRVDIEDEEKVENSNHKLPDFSGKTLLLAEDIEINAEILVSLLEDTKLEIDIACNGVVAWEKFANNPSKYDIIFMDIQMPQMNGFDATRNIRALKVPEAQNVPIIAMTANAFKEDVEKCLECGMNAHLAKPINLDKILETLESYLK